MQTDSSCKQEQLPSGECLTLVPLVFEYFGCWGDGVGGEKAQEFLKETSNESKDQDERSNSLDPRILDK